MSVFRVVDNKDGSVLAIVFSEDMARKALTLFPDEIVDEVSGHKRYAYEDCAQYMILDNVISLLKSKVNRRYDGEVPEYAAVFTVEYWKEAVEDGSFMNYDGHGYWVKDGKESRDEVFSTEPLDATHVAWYNK